MNRPKTTESLPENENFWKAVDSQEQKDFHNAVILDMIRGFNGSTERDMIEFIAKLKFCVDMIDAPRSIYLSIQRKSAIEQQLDATAELLSDD